MNVFKAILLVVFATFGLIGFLVFSGIIPFPGGTGVTPRGVAGQATIWGVYPYENIKEPLEALNGKNKDAYAVSYVQKRAGTFDRELVEALASGRGPDLILLPQDLIVRHIDKIAPIQYETLPIPDFKNTYIEEGELYLNPIGIIALPFSIDPIVMFWNRDLLSSAAIARPPAQWDELFTMSPRLTVTDQALNVRRSAVALGEYQNVEHAKEILSMLIMQAGNPIVTVGERGLQSVLHDNLGFTTSPAESALRFYTEFSNPVKTTYSWNRALPNSKEMFITGDLAIYFGFASEIRDIRFKNPHLNFDIASVPQTRDADVRATFGNISGLAVLKTSRNQSTAFFAAFELTGREFIQALAQESGLPPVRRDLLVAAPDDPFGQVLYSSALIAKAWLDPQPQATEFVFRDMIEGFVSGRNTSRDSVLRASGQINNIIQSR